MLCILSGEIVVVESFEIVYSPYGMKNSIYDGDGDCVVLCCVVLYWGEPVERICNYNLLSICLQSCIGRVKWRR
jgi:hypothetical protein